MSEFDRVAWEISRSVMRYEAQIFGLLERREQTEVLSWRMSLFRTLDGLLELNAMVTSTNILELFKNTASVDEFKALIEAELSQTTDPKVAQFFKEQPKILAWISTRSTALLHKSLKSLELDIIFPNNYRLLLSTLTVLRKNIRYDLHDTYGYKDPGSLFDPSSTLTFAFPPFHNYSIDLQFIEQDSEMTFLRERHVHRLSDRADKLSSSESEKNFDLGGFIFVLAPYIDTFHKVSAANTSSLLSALEQIKTIKSQLSWRPYFLGPKSYNLEISEADLESFVKILTVLDSQLSSIKLGQKKLAPLLRTMDHSMSYWIKDQRVSLIREKNSRLTAIKKDPNGIINQMYIDQGAELKVALDYVKKENQIISSELKKFSNLLEHAENKLAEVRNELDVLVRLKKHQKKIPQTKIWDQDINR